VSLFLVLTGLLLTVILEDTTCSTGACIPTIGTAQLNQCIRIIAGQVIYSLSPYVHRGMLATTMIDATRTSPSETIAQRSYLLLSSDSEK
jgi:hypothetical protein